MGYLRFRRSRSIVPGLRMNLSKSGASWSLGPRGAHFTIGPRGRRTTIGIPGTGVSYTTYSHHHAHRAAAAPRAGSAPHSTPATGTPLPAHHQPMLPRTKTVWAVVIAVIGVLTILTPAGIVLLVIAAVFLGVGLTQRNQPVWQVRALIRRARSHPDQAGVLLPQALILGPDNAEALAANAEHHFDQHDWQAAAELYERYLAIAPQDWLAEGHAANAWLNSGHPDAAIPHFITIREKPFLTDDSRASITAGLAMAFLHKGDARQALDLARSEPLQRHSLEEGMQQCLFVRALAHYQLGQHSQGISDLDRLAGINPTFASLNQMRNEMLQGRLLLDGSPPTAAAPATPSRPAPAADHP